MSDIQFKTTCVFGHSEIRSWLEYRHDQEGRPILVGVGSSTEYDQQGNLVSHKVSETGLIFRLDNDF